MTRASAWIAVLVVLLASAGVARAEGGDAALGSWTLVWRLSELDQGTNEFRRTLGDGPVFPFRARTLSGLAGPRVLLFDPDGNVDGEIALAAGERALVAGDGVAHLIWSADPLRKRQSMFRYFREGNPEPLWEASARGDPVLFAPDGTLFVLAAPDTGVDRYQRSWTNPGGRVQIVDDRGNVRGEMPIYPVYVRLTGDGARIAMLHPKELVVLRRDGVLDWSADVPIDAVVARDGHSQLEAAGSVIVVCGTGAVAASERTTRSLHGERRGTLRAFSNTGALLWSRDQSGEDRLWFQISVALSSDGGTLATFHSDGRKTLVRLIEARTGELFWERAVSRQPGAHTLSLSPDGQLVALCSGEARTHVLAWDREGTPVWEGEIPLASREARLGSHGLLVAERWIVRLEPEEAP